MGLLARPLSKEPRNSCSFKERVFLVHNIVRGNFIHNTGGSLNVMRLLSVHKMPAGLLPPTHP